MKRVIRYIAGLVAVIAMVIMGTSMVSAAEKTVTEDGFEYICDFYHKTATITKYTGDEENVVFPSELEGCKVTAITGEKQSYPDYYYLAYDRVIYNQDEIVSVTIPDTVEEIGMNAFKNCRNLKTVKMSKKLKVLGGNAFGGCTSLVSVTFPASLQELKKCETQTYMGVKYYDGAFHDCTSLQTVTFSEKSKFTEIPDSTFQNCSSLSTVLIPKSVEKIGRCAFNSCSSLTEVSIPGSVKNMGSNVFNQCISLKKLTLNSGLERIEGWSFAGTSIKKVTIPDTVTFLGNNMFTGCAELESAVVGKGLTSLTAGVFQDCTALKKVTLKNGLQTMDREVFKNSGLEAIVIPATVTSIGSNVFTDCANLKKAYILGNPVMSGFQSGMRTTLYGYKESTVQNYAKDTGLGFTALERPTNVKAAKKSKTSVKVSWKKVKGVSKYTVYRSTSPDGAFKKLKTVSASSYTDKTVKKGTTYYYYVTIEYKDNDGIVLSGIRSETTSIVFPAK